MLASCQFQVAVYGVVQVAVYSKLRVFQVTCIPSCCVFQVVVYSKFPVSVLTVETISHCNEFPLGVMEEVDSVSVPPATAGEGCGQHIPTYQAIVTSFLCTSQLRPHYVYQSTTVSFYTSHLGQYSNIPVN